MFHTEPMVELARRIPVEHMEIDAAPAALDGDGSEPRHQPTADPPAARLFGDVEVFELQPRPAEPGQKPRVVQRASRRLAVDKGQDRLGAPLRTGVVAE